MLFKHTSSTAKSAKFFVATSEPVRSNDADQPLESVKRPSKEELEIARLNEELETLQRRLDDLTAKWDDELADAYGRARADAAEQHVRDDAKMSAAMIEGLAKARETFDASLCEHAGELGSQLASVALGRLVAESDVEREWLVRSIARRVADLRAGAIVAVHMAPKDLTEAVLTQVRAALPVGTEIVPDPEIEPGTARFALKLGTVTIDPRKGLRALLEAIDASQP